MRNIGNCSTFPYKIYQIWLVFNRSKDILIVNYLHWVDIDYIGDVAIIHTLSGLNLRIGDVTITYTLSELNPRIGLNPRILK